MEAATVTFECPPEYVLTGPNTTTCMRNGKWVPDPREVECKLEGMLVNFVSLFPGSPGLFNLFMINIEKLVKGPENEQIDCIGR